MKANSFISKLGDILNDDELERLKFIPAAALVAPSQETLLTPLRSTSAMKNAQKSSNAFVVSQHLIC